jgi:transcriptional regulator with XRE-family HTH domain
VISTDLQRREFGARVRTLREAKGWSQSDLAREVGVKPSTVGNWEQFVSGTSKETAERLRQALGEPVGHLLGIGLPPATVSPEDAVLADPELPDDYKRVALDVLASLRRLAQGRTGTRPRSTAAGPAAEASRAAGDTEGVAS